MAIELKSTPSSIFIDEFNFEGDVIIQGKIIVNSCKILLGQM